MDEALSRAIPMARSQASAVVTVAGSWRPRRMVDIGAGTGSMLRVLSQQNFAQEYAAVDISELSVSFINHRPFPSLVGAIKAPAEQLPHKDHQSFDLATLSHVRDHLSDPLIALEEASRVASKGPDIKALGQAAPAGTVLGAQVR
jgi:ubiquinone/menaquinone biosynthesis C-methylase UbiE